MCMGTLPLSPVKLSIKKAINSKNYKAGSEVPAHIILHLDVHASLESACQSFASLIQHYPTPKGTQTLRGEKIYTDYMHALIEFTQCDPDLFDTLYEAVCSYKNYPTSFHTPDINHSKELEMYALQCITNDPTIKERSLQKIASPTIASTIPDLDGIEEISNSGTKRKRTTKDELLFLPLIEYFEQRIEHSNKKIKYDIELNITIAHALNTLKALEGKTRAETLKMQTLVTAMLQEKAVREQAVSLRTAGNEKLTKLIDLFHEYEKTNKDYQSFLKQRIGKFSPKNPSLGSTLKESIEKFNEEPLIAKHHALIIQEMNFFQTCDYYTILNITPRASSEDIIKAYNKFIIEGSTDKDKHYQYNAALCVLLDYTCRGIYATLYADIERFLSAYQQDGIHCLCSYTDEFLHTTVNRCNSLSDRISYLLSTHVLKVLLKEIITLCKNELTLRKDSPVYQAYFSCIIVQQECELISFASSSPSVDKVVALLMSFSRQNSPSSEA